MVNHSSDMAESVPAKGARRIVFRWEAGLFAGMLALAILLRVVALEKIPPGMQHDEVFDARFATYVLNGARPVFFDENGGVPPLFSYLVAGVFALLGRNLIALRLTSSLLGVLGLAISYPLLRRLVGRPTALLTLASLTVSFWHLFDSRVGIEPILAPLMAGLSFLLFWRALQRQSLVWYALAGMSMGLAQYAHRTGLLIPLTAVLFVLYLLLTRHPLLDAEGEGTGRARRRHIWGLTLMIFMVILVAAPLIFHVFSQPAQSMLRVQQLSHNLTALWAGDPVPILQDVAGLLGMFGLRGDPEWRYNIAGRPIFDPLTGLLFWAGVFLCFRRRQQPGNLFLLFWLVITLLMAAVTPPSPASTRALVAIIPIYAMPAVALVAGWRWAKQRHRPDLAALAGVTAASLLIGNTVWNVHDYFFVWPRHPEVRTIYRADLALAADYLEKNQPAGVVCISAQFAADLDQQIFDYILDYSRPIKWFDARRVLVIPAAEDDQPLTYLFPASDTATPAIARRLNAVASTVDRLNDVTGSLALEVYHLDSGQVKRLREITPTYPLAINLDDEIDLLGYDLPERVSAGEPVDLTAYWQTRRGGRGDLTFAFFAHLLDSRGFLWAQDDPTGFPSHSWWPGDMVVQFFDLTAPVDMPPGVYHLDMGVYEKTSGRRLAQMEGDGSGSDVIMLHPLAVLAASRPPQPEEIDIKERVNASFEGLVTLVGYEVSDRILDLKEKTEVSLLWQAGGEPLPALEIELVLLDEDGRLWPLLVRQPFDGNCPLDQWTVGQMWRDRFWIVHDPTIRRGIYQLRLALVDVSTGRRLAGPDEKKSISLGQVFMRGRN